MEIVFSEKECNEIRFSGLKDILTEWATNHQKLKEDNRRRMQESKKWDKEEDAYADRNRKRY